MADDTKKPTDDTELPSAETTLGKDSDLSINQPVAASPAEPKPAETSTMNVTKPAEPVPTASAATVDFTPPPTSQPSPTLDAETAPLISATEAAEPTAEAKESDAKPVMINEKEAEAADDLAAVAPGSTQELGEQVETLTGEIQALESKIEQLAGNPTAVETKAPTTEVPLSKTADSSLPPSAPESAKIADTLPGETVKPAAKAADGASPEALKTSPSGEKSAVATFSDIFAKSDKDKSPKATETKLADTQPATPPAADKGMVLPDAEPASATATIGEVLAFLGIFVLALLLVGPYYKSLVGDTLYATIKAVGWLVAPTSLLISFIVLLFAKGKALLKIAVFILLLVSLVFYFGLNTTGTISDQLNNVLGTVFSTYK
ncbi:MAG TPA: hypothetical protein VLE93_00015 [Candidatus Saccharimonadales bacterium]|nr:hypothetical protein [Candidatus Saccharimonadales bacterium]